MKFFSKNVVIVILAVVVLLIGALAGFVVLTSVNPSGSLANASDVVASNQHTEAPKTEPGMMYTMNERVVNLADTGGFRYLKIQVVLEFDFPEAKGLKGEAYKKKQDEFVKDMASRRPKMDDILTSTLAGKTSTVLSSAEGREKLRDELRTKLSDAAGEHGIQSVYFTQFIIQ